MTTSFIATDLPIYDYVLGKFGYKITSLKGETSWKSFVHAVIEYLEKDNKDINVRKSASWAIAMQSLGLLNKEDNEYAKYRSDYLKMPKEKQDVSDATIREIIEDLKIRYP